MKRTPPTKHASTSKVATPEIPSESRKMEVNPLSSENHLVPPISSQHKHDSAPDLHRAQEEASNNVTMRFKRKFYVEENSANMESVMEQMKSMLAAFSLDQANRLKDLQTSISKIEKQNDDIANCVEFLSQRYDEILLSVKELEEEKRKDKKQIQELEKRIGFLERKVMGPSIEIRNLPIQMAKEQKGYEAKEFLSGILKNMGQSINVEIQEGDIKDIYSIKSKTEDKRTIFVEFCSVIKKEKVIDAVIQFNKGKQNKDKLNGGHLKLQNTKVPIFVAEALSRNGQKLLFATRQFVKQHGFARAWSYRGAIYVRKAEKEKPIKIESEADLQNILTGI